MFKVNNKDTRTTAMAELEFKKEKYERSPTKGSRKATARERETNQISDGITATTNSTNAYVHGKFNAKIDSIKAYRYICFALIDFY